MQETNLQKGLKLKFSLKLKEKLLSVVVFGHITARYCHYTLMLDTVIRLVGVHVFEIQRQQK